MREFQVNYSSGSVIMSDKFISKLKQIILYNHVKSFYDLREVVIKNLQYRTFNIIKKE
jgi:hypothetical protein